MKLRLLSLASISLVWACHCSLVAGQTPPQKNARQFARLFRSESDLASRPTFAADGSSSVAEPKTVIPEFLELDDTDKVLLENVCIKWQMRTITVRDAFNAEVGRWRSNLPLTGYRPGRDPAPPESLIDYRAQQSAITLESIGELESGLGPTKFALLNARVGQVYGASSSVQTQVSGSGGQK